MAHVIKETRTYLNSNNINVSDLQRKKEQMLKLLDGLGKQNKVEVAIKQDVEELSGEIKILTDRISR